jgi:hypothetical protein
MSEAKNLPERQTAFVKESPLYKEFLAEREEILRHKWLESERLGYDIGFERALLDWIRKHRDGWRRSRRQVTETSPAPSNRLAPRNAEGDLASKSPSKVH